MPSNRKAGSCKHYSVDRIWHVRFLAFLQSQNDHERKGFDLFQDTELAPVVQLQTLTMCTPRTASDSGKNSVQSMRKTRGSIWRESNEMYFLQQQFKRKLLNIHYIFQSSCIPRIFLWQHTIACFINDAYVLYEPAPGSFLKSF